MELLQKCVWHYWDKCKRHSTHRCFCYLLFVSVGVSFCSVFFTVRHLAKHSPVNADTHHNYIIQYTINSVQHNTAAAGCHTLHTHSNRHASSLLVSPAQLLLQTLLSPCCTSPTSPFFLPQCICQRSSPAESARVLGKHLSIPHEGLLEGRRAPCSKQQWLLL